jgi:hypothetical protein
MIPGRLENAAPKATFLPIQYAPKDDDLQAATPR